MRIVLRSTEQYFIISDAFAPSSGSTSVDPGRDLWRPAERLKVKSEATVDSIHRLYDGKFSDSTANDSSVLA